MGPLLGLLVQPIVGALSDRTWLMKGRRRPYLLAGGAAGAASTYALLELDTLAAATGLSLIAVAVLVALVADLATNVTYNPAPSLVADLTPEGPARVQGYAWMHTVSGVLGISAYLISVFFGNLAQVLVTVAVVFFLTLLPLLWGIAIVRQGRRRPSSQNRLTTMLLGTASHGWACRACS